MSTGEELWIFSQEDVQKTLISADSVSWRHLKLDWKTSKTSYFILKGCPLAINNSLQNLWKEGSFETGLKLDNSGIQAGFLVSSVACLKVLGTTPEDRLLLIRPGTDGSKTEITSLKNPGGGNLKAFDDQQSHIEKIERLKQAKGSEQGRETEGWKAGVIYEP